MITGNLGDAGKPTTVLVDAATPDGIGCGLRGRSLVKCYNLAAVRQNRMLQVIGHMSAAVMRKVNDALRVALELP